MPGFTLARHRRCATWPLDGLTFIVLHLVAGEGFGEGEELIAFLVAEGAVVAQVGGVFFDFFGLEAAGDEGANGEGVDVAVHVFDLQAGVDDSSDAFDFGGGLIPWFGGEHVAVGEGLHGEDAVVVFEEFGEDLHDEGVPVGVDEVHGHEAGVEEDLGFAQALDEMQVRGGRAVTGEAEVADEAFFAGFKKLVNDAVLPALVDVGGTGDGVDLPKVEVVGLHAAQRGFELFAGAFSVFGEGLGGEVDVVAVFGREVFAVEDFGLAVAVLLRGVEAADAGLDGGLDELLGDGFGFCADDMGATEGEGGDSFASAAEGASGEGLSEFVGGVLGMSEGEGYGGGGEGLEEGAAIGWHGGEIGCEFTTKRLAGW